MLTKTLITLTLLLLVTTAQAATLKGGSPACLTEDLFDQFISSIVKKDQQEFDYLQKKGCMVLSDNINLNASVLDRSWNGVTKIRAYIDGKPIVLWTNTESVSD